MQLRYGILSTSSIAPRFIAGVREARAGEILAVSSRSLEKAREKAQEWKIPRAYGSHWELLQDPEVNIVYISTVNAQHYPWAKAALEHGKHVVCEKPCTTTQAQTRELFTLAAERGLFFMEAEKMLFLPVMTQVRRRIENGDLGQIAAVRLSHSFSPGYNSWQFDESAGGGTLLSSGIYVTQLLTWMFGPIREISGYAERLPGQAERQYLLSGVTEGGVLFSAQNSTLVQLDNTAWIYGSRGSVEIPNYWKARKAVFRLMQGEEVVEYPCEHELAYEAAHIRDCLEQGLLTSPVVTPELSAAGIAALEKVKAGWR